MRDPEKKYSYVLHLARLAMTMLGISQFTEPVLAQCLDNHQGRGTAEQSSKSPAEKQMLVGPIIHKLRR